MIVVSDASPITNLARIRRLEILRLVFGDVVIPAGVHAELLAGPSGAAALESAPWIRLEALSDLTSAAELEKELDRGEAEAIALAVHLKADLLLMDERLGRAVALRRGLRRMGLVGVLLEAKRVGVIDAVRPLLDDLVTLAGFYLHRAVYEQAVRDAGEQL